MGRGNFYPHVEGHYKMVYVSIPFDMDERATEIWHDRLEQDVLDELPDTFSWMNHGGYDDMLKIAESGTVEVLTADNEWSRALIFYAPGNLGVRHVDSLSKRVFNNLLEEGYELRVRCGSWTSGTYTP
jgi:hypothetical protein